MLTFRLCNTCNCIKAFHISENGLVGEVAKSLIALRGVSYQIGIMFKPTSQPKCPVSQRECNTCMWSRVKDIPTARKRTLSILGVVARQKVPYSLIGWLVFRIYVVLAIFQPYRDLEAGDNKTNLWNFSGEAGNRTPSCSACQKLNHYTTAAPLIQNNT